MNYLEDIYDLVKKVEYEIPQQVFRTNFKNKLYTKFNLLPSFDFIHELYINGDKNMSDKLHYDRNMRESYEFTLSLMKLRKKVEELVLKELERYRN